MTLVFEDVARPVGKVVLGSELKWSRSSVVKLRYLLFRLLSGPHDPGTESAWAGGLSYSLGFSEGSVGSRHAA